MASGSVTVDLTTQAQQNTGAGGLDTLQNIESVNGSGFADTLIGNDAANVLNGGSSNDLLNGGGGNDTLIGGNGVDTASYAGGPSGVTVSLAVTGAQNTGGAGTDVLTSIENLTGSSYNDMLTGSAGDNELVGGAGNDKLNGGAGDDLIDGGTDTDTVTYAGASAGVTVTLATTAAQNTGGAGTDTIRNVEYLTGSSFNDSLTGNAGDNALDAGIGNDTLVGGSGNDWLRGGAGNDTLDGGIGIDTVSYADTTAGVVVNLAVTAAQNTGGAGTDTLSNLENLTGSSFNDNLSGSSAANALVGGLGNDTLDGSNGLDALTGGAGADTFRFSTSLGASNIDTITDFVAADDTFSLKTSIFTGLSAGVLASSAFNTGSAASQADDRIIYNAATGALLFDRDGSGTTYAAVQFATIGKNLTLSNADFVVQ